MTLTYSGYFENALVKAARQETLENAIRILTPHAHTFTAIAVRGTSGLLMGPAIADRMGKDLIVIRKPSDNSHASTTEYGPTSDTPISYIIVDDFVSSGHTVGQIREALNPYNTTLVGIYQYNPMSGSHSDIPWIGKGQSYGYGARDKV